jgi:hypothetical protein
MCYWSIYRLVVLNRGWKRDCLLIMIFGYVCSTWGIVELKTHFESWITRNDLNGVSLFHLAYLITLMAYLCSQKRPNVQIKNLMFHWSFYRLFVLNTCWNHDSLQMMIRKYLLDISVVKLNTRLETWIGRNDLNVVYWFHFYYLITFWVYLCSQ